MKVTAAMLADAAHAHQGKLYVHGGGWDTIRAREFPTVHASMALALLLRVEYDEAPGTIQLTIEMVDEDMHDEPRLSAQAQVQAGHPPGLRRGAPTFVPLTLTFQSQRFEEPGAFEFRVTNSDGALLASVPLNVRRLPGT